ncbi:DUF1877 family protein, partial [Streptacidiphilus sp. MAP5-52]|uniref:DUF1877 family protein n=1 Tax=Streptacidiphilus sp. MAP5-52 TaxID=3156267 RepID=UPI0035145D02
ARYCEYPVTIAGREGRWSRCRSRVPGCAAMGIYSSLSRVDADSATAVLNGGPWPRPEMREGERFRAILSLDKQWGVLQWLLRAAGCPVDPIMGTAFLEDQAIEMAPPGYLDAVEVQAAADFLRQLAFEALTVLADEDAMDADDVYPTGYDSERAEELRETFADLRRFYEAAAAAGQWVLTELS